MPSSFEVLQKTNSDLWCRWRVALINASVRLQFKLSNRFNNCVTWIIDPLSLLQLKFKCVTSIVYNMTLLLGA